jgi:hypothetical protein
MPDRDVILKRLVRAFLEEARSMTPPSIILAVVFWLAAFGFRYFVTRELPWQDFVSVLVPTVWAACGVGLWCLIRAALKLRRDDVAAWEADKPKIPEAPRPPKPSVAPLVAATVFSCGLLGAVICMSLLLPYAQRPRSTPALVSTARRSTSETAPIPAPRSRSATKERSSPSGRIQFTSTPLWTNDRRSMVREHIEKFDQYLSSIHIMPPPKLPLLSITKGRGTSYISFCPDNPPPFGQRKIAVATERLSPMAIRKAYGEYVCETLLVPAGTCGDAIEVWAGWIYSEYFAASSLAIAPGAEDKLRLNRWVAALWDIRKELGQDFADRAAADSLRAMAKTETHGSDDYDRYFGKRLQVGVLTVQNDFKQFTVVNKILKRYGLLNYSR